MQMVTCRQTLRKSSNCHVEVFCPSFIARCVIRESHVSLFGTEKLRHSRMLAEIGQSFF